jgi:cobalt-zinc-cadmium resistance protein CzcA
VLLAVVLLIGAGIYSLKNLPIDAVPDVTNVQVQVLTAAPALAPLDVERQITFPVEVAMSGLPDIAEIRSVSKFGLSAVTVVFDDSVNIYFARQLVLERLSQAREQIPADIGAPEMGPISTGLGEIYQYELKSRARGGIRRDSAAHDSGLERAAAIAGRAWRHGSQQLRRF